MVGVWARPMASAGPDPLSSRRSNTVQCGAIPPSVPPDITRHTSLARAPTCFSSISMMVCIAKPREKSLTFPLPSVLPRTATIPSEWMRPSAIARSMPLTSSGADAEMRWTQARMSATGRFEIVAHGAFEMRQCGGERAVLRNAVAEAREQLAVHCRQIDTGNLAIAHDRLAADDQLFDVAHGRACEQEVEWVETGTQAVRIEPVPVDDQHIGRRAGHEDAAFIPVGHRAAAVDQNGVEQRLSIDIDAESSSGVQQVREAHFAQRIVVLVEGRTVEAERDAAAALHHLGQRRNARAQLQVRRGVDRYGHTAFGQQFQLVRPRPGAMRKRQAFTEKPDCIEVPDDAFRKVLIRPTALIARLEQMHMDAPSAPRGCSRDGL